MARKIKDGSYTQWYRHNIDRWQGSAEINALSCEGYRAFHNLVMYQFQRPDGLLPDDERTLRVQSRLPLQSQWDGCRAEVLAMFERKGEGKLANMVMYREWLFIQEAREAKSNAGRTGAKALWDGEPDMADACEWDSNRIADACQPHEVAMAENGTEQHRTVQYRR